MVRARRSDPSRARPRGGAASSPAPRRAPPSLRVDYTVATPAPESHLFHVEMRVAATTAPLPRPLRVAMPAWAPGSYLIRDFARHVQDFEARSSSGRALAWSRVDKQSWSIEPPEGGGAVVIRYKVYANELSVQTSHLDATHAYANGTSLFAYVVDHKDAPCRLLFRDLPRGWRIDVPLPDVGPRSFAARDYDELVDAPFEVGTHRRLEFRVRGKRHRIALYGRGNEDAERLARDLQRIVTEEAAIWGGLPYDEYLFIIHLNDRAGGGLEHRGANTSTVDRWTFQPGKKYEDFLALEAHEFFHTWNVKRLRPLVLGPFDYSREVHTTLLWAMEGLTSYYDHLVLARLGLISEERYRDFLAETITKLRQQPGRFKLSLAQSSFLAWIKLYKIDANWVNSGVSYYLKGELLGLALDLAIRERTRGRKSLDDVLRELYRRYPADGPGIPEPHAGGKDGWREALEDVTGLSWRAFWRAYIEGTEELDLERHLARVGWKLRPVARNEKADEKLKKGEYATPGAWLGAETKEVERRLRVANVLAGSPAERAGLAPEDELVALDGFQLKDKEALDKRLRERAAGERATLHVFRRQELVPLDVRLAAPPPEKWVVEEDKPASSVAKRLRRAWLAPASSRATRAPRPVVSKGSKPRVARRE